MDKMPVYKFLDCHKIPDSLWEKYMLKIRAEVPSASLVDLRELYEYQYSGREVEVIRYIGKLYSTIDLLGVRIHIKGDYEPKNIFLEFLNHFARMKSFYILNINEDLFEI